MSNSIDLLRGAVRDAESNYLQVTVDHLTLETPCEGWDLRALLNHVYSRMDLSTRAARLQPTEDFAIVEIDHVGGDPAGAFTLLAGEMLAAWEECDDLVTPRVTPMGPIPPDGILLFGAQDVFIHAWDVARALSTEPVLSDEMIEVFTDSHKQSIDEQTRAMFFSDPVVIDDDASALDKLVAFLGRQP